MRHGYTNRTERRGDVVRKEYDGPDRDRRASAEHDALVSLAGRFPVPEVVAHERDCLTTRFVVGSHGQDLVERGHAAPVLATCGRALRRLHELTPPASWTDDPTAVGVFSHGDFGPNNVLLDADCTRVVAVLDWEFAAVADPIIDVAWCEWIVRTHHPDAVDDLDAFFDEYGDRPPWMARQDEMVRRCGELAAFCDRWQPGGPAVMTWRERSRVTASWAE